jgi:hypothetical protein
VSAAPGKYQSATALYLPHGGEIRACTSGSASKDGGKETWVVRRRDAPVRAARAEEHVRHGQPEPGQAMAEPWLMQTSTAYRPGEQSVFEETLTAWRKGELSSSVLWTTGRPRAASTWTTRTHTKAQLRQVYGEAAGWMDLNRIYRNMRDPRICKDDARRPATT